LITLSGYNLFAPPSVLLEEVTVLIYKAVFKIKELIGLNLSSHPKCREFVVTRCILRGVWNYGCIKMCLRLP